MRRFVRAQYHRGQITVDRLTRLLRDLGVDISKRQSGAAADRGAGRLSR